MFDQLIGSPTGLISSTKTDEVHRPEDYSSAEAGYVYYLKTYRPTSITTVQAVAPGTLGTDYTLEGRRLEMKTGVNIPSTFPFYWKITYVSGYLAADLPRDVKMAVMVLCKAYWVQRQATGISSFKQDLLSVSYDKGIVESITSETERNQITATVQKYKIPYTYAS